MKKYINIILTILAISLIFYIFTKVSEAARNKQIVQCQKEQIIIKNEVIKIKEVVRKRKAVAKSVSPSVNLEWLQAHACSDCDR